MPTKAETFEKAETLRRAQAAHLALSQGANIDHVCRFLSIEELTLLKTLSDFKTEVAKAKQQLDQKAPGANS